MKLQVTKVAIELKINLGNFNHITYSLEALPIFGDDETNPEASEILRTCERATFKAALEKAAEKINTINKLQGNLKEKK